MFTENTGGHPSRGVPEDQSYYDDGTYYTNDQGQGYDQGYGDGQSYYDDGTYDQSAYDDGQGGYYDDGQGGYYDDGTQYDDYTQGEYSRDTRGID